MKKRSYVKKIGCFQTTKYVLKMDAQTAEEVKARNVNVNMMSHDVG
jgi:hypothetical protein